MRICFYTETALPKIGGQELVIDALARQFLALGHEPLVLAPPPKNRRVAAHDAALPYQVVRHPRFFSTRYLVEWYAMFLRRAWRQHRFDVLHCHSIYPCAYLAALSKDQLGIPTVITSHGGDVHAEGRRLLKPGIPARYTRSLAAADALVSISKFTTAGYQRLCPTATNIEAIPNGVHLGRCSSASGTAPRWHRRQGHRRRIHSVSRSIESPQRGRHFGRRALPIAGKRYNFAGDRGRWRRTSGARCTMCSTGTGGSRCTSSALPWRGKPKVWLLQNARFTVIPSRTWEAFPLVVLESFAAGKPVIGTMIPGLADLVEPERTGLLVPPESPPALADALAALLKNEAVTREYGRHAQRIVQEFDWAKIAEQHLDLYARLCGKTTADRSRGAPRAGSPWRSLDVFGNFSRPRRHAIAASPGCEQPGTFTFVRPLRLPSQWHLCAICGAPPSLKESS